MLAPEFYFLFAGNMILYLKNPKETTKINTIKIKAEVSHVAGSLQGIRARRQDLLPVQSCWNTLSML